MVDVPYGPGSTSNFQRISNVKVCSANFTGREQCGVAHTIWNFVGMVWFVFVVVFRDFASAVPSILFFQCTFSLIQAAAREEIQGLDNFFQPGVLSQHSHSLHYNAYHNCYNYFQDEQHVSQWPRTKDQTDTASAKTWVCLLAYSVKESFEFCPL